VFEHEPAVPPALLRLPRVALTPHIGGDTHEAEERALTLLRANLEAYFDGRPLATPIPG
jgi:phosphoglycerate dehydrogenase-like enzyme